MSMTEFEYRVLNRLTEAIERLAEAVEKSNQPPEPDFKLAEPEPKKVRSAPKRRHEYEPEFERLWLRYPARNGSNDKWKAQQCWRARLKEAKNSHGNTRLREMDAMFAGVDRYAKWCKATGKIGTGYVMQAPRFLGTAKEYQNSWEIPVEEKVLKLPRDLNELVKFAAEKGINTLPGESEYDFRKRIEDRLT